MGLPLAASGEYTRIPGDFEAGKPPPPAAAPGFADCPSVLRWRAVRWWAQVAVLGVLLAGAAAAALVFLGPLVINKVRSPSPPTCSRGAFRDLGRQQNFQCPPISCVKWASQGGDVVVELNGWMGSSLSPRRDMSERFFANR
jgi:hypothetical protein